MHDVLLSTLESFRADFTLLVKANAPAFTKYLDAQAGPKAGDDEEIDENELGDVNSRIEHASCKAELIDIGIPRRGSASGLEEWTRLGAAGALKTVQNGVIYPHREYYLNEYLMMIRQAFVDTAGAKKAPKRITRFGLILASDAEPLAGVLDATQSGVAADVGVAHALSELMQAHWGEEANSLASRTRFSPPSFESCHSSRTRNCSNAVRSSRSPAATRPGSTPVTSASNLSGSNRSVGSS